MTLHKQRGNSIMNILIIGSKGFIGSHCLDHYRSKGHQVFGCDVVVDYADAQYFLIDATNADYKEVFESQVFDACINCSGAASVPESLHHPRRDFELNTLNVFRVLDAIRQFNPGCQFIQLSSAAVYGNPASLPVKEESALQPISPYGWHKSYSEQVCREFVSVYQLKVAILRPFSVFGPGLKKQLFWDVYHKLKSGTAFTLFGTGEETRDFIYIHDLVSLTELVIQQGSFSGEVYNAANGTAVKIKDAIRLFKALTNYPTEYAFSKQVKAGDPLYWQADISKALAMGYKQQVSMEEGLKDYIRWVSENG